MNGYDAFGVGPNQSSAAIVIACHAADAESRRPDADSPIERLDGRNRHHSARTPDRVPVVIVAS
jgi:hypothetical protein